MATSTTNLGLTKPAGTDKIRIAQINGNMDILDDKIGAVGNTSLQAQVTSQNQAIATLNSDIGITELSSATSLVTLISNMGNLTIRHYFATNKNNLTDFPQALIDVGAIYYIHIDIEKRGTTIANVIITAVDSVNHPVSITGEYYSGTLYWGLTADALNEKIDNKLFKKLTATTDFNSISDDGIYLVDWVSGGTTYNRPVNQGGRLEHSTSTTGNQPTKQQTFITYAGNAYVRGFSNNSWTAWKELALNEDLSNKATLIDVYSAAGSWSKTITTSSTCRFIIFVSGMSANRNAMAFVSADSSNAILTPIGNYGSEISITKNNNVITITSSSTGTVRADVLMILGNGTELAIS